MIILSLAVFSTVFTILSALIIFHINGSLTSSTSYSSEMYSAKLETAIIRFPYAPASITLSVVGWLLTGYELFSKREKDVSTILRKEVSGKRDRWEIYHLFKGRGGARRLTIMESLDMPRHRSEIANKTDTDWKEVDRNIKVLETANLVKMELSKDSSVLYELTEEGEKVLHTIMSRIKG